MSEYNCRFCGTHIQSSIEPFCDRCWDGERVDTGDGHILETGNDWSKPQIWFGDERDYTWNGMIVKVKQEMRGS